MENHGKLCVGCDQCNRRSPLFSDLSMEELRLLNMDRYSVWFREGEVILKQGTQAKYLVSVVEGFTKQYIEGHHDRNLVLDFVKPWHLVGAPGVHMNGKYNFTLVAIRETLVCFIDAENFKKVLSMNSGFSNAYIQFCSASYGRSLDRMVSLSQKQMHGRIADALIFLSGEVFESPTISGEISRQDVADYTSMSKDSAIRILKEFERDQIIRLDGRFIEVLAPDRLEKISLTG